MLQQAEIEADEDMLLAAMANPRRLAILRVLLKSEASVGDLVRRVNLSQSTTSQHLSKLREAGIVAKRRDKQVIYYSLVSPKARAILRVLDEF